MAQRAAVPPIGRAVLRRTEQEVTPGAIPPVAVFQVLAIMSTPQLCAPAAPIGEGCSSPIIGIGVSVGRSCITAAVHTTS